MTTAPPPHPMLALRMSELLERMQQAGVAQVDIDGVFKEASPKRAAIVLLERQQSTSLSDDPAMELHEMALEAEVLLGKAAPDGMRAAKDELAQGEMQPDGSPLAEQISQLAVRRQLTRVRASVYARLTTGSVRVCAA